MMPRSYRIVGSIMSERPTNRVKVLRRERNWSQQELASSSRLSRAEISAIETNRLVPSVTAALRLSEAFGCAVEELFALPRSDQDRQRWAGNHPRRTRFWRSQFGDATVLYPTEATPIGALPHDGVAHDDRLEIVNDTSPSETLVVSGCDPAVGLLAAEYSRQTGFRLLPLGRGSRKGLELLEEKVVHIAGLHLTDENGRPDNQRSVQERLGSDFRLLHLASWEEGLAFSAELDIHSPAQAALAPIAWAVREEGSGARACLDRILRDSGRDQATDRQTMDHRTTAEAIRSGSAQAGICVQLAAEEAGLSFLKVQLESYDLCYPAEMEGDPRFIALLRVVRSVRFRRLISDLPGYDARLTGEKRPA